MVTFCPTSHNGPHSQRSPHWYAPTRASSQAADWQTLVRTVQPAETGTASSCAINLVPGSPNKFGGVWEKIKIRVWAALLHGLLPPV